MRYIINSLVKKSKTKTKTKTNTNTKTKSKPKPKSQIKTTRKKGKLSIVKVFPTLTYTEKKLKTATKSSVSSLTTTMSNYDMVEKMSGCDLIGIISVSSPKSGEYANIWGVLSNNIMTELIKQKKITQAITDIDYLIPNFITHSAFFVGYTISNPRTKKSFNTIYPNMSYNFPRIVNEQPQSFLQLTNADIVNKFFHDLGDIFVQQQGVYIDANIFYKFYYFIYDNLYYAISNACETISDYKHIPPHIASSIIASMVEEVKALLYYMSLENEQEIKTFIYTIGSFLSPLLN
jgi:hypothetical protein